MTTEDVHNTVLIRLLKLHRALLVTVRRTPSYGFGGYRIKELLERIAREVEEIIEEMVK